MKKRMEKYQKESRMRKDKVEGVESKDQKEVKREDDLDKHKPTPGCPGCSALRRAIAYQPHSPECRRKFEELLENEAK
eukprot:11121064-Karenia_brevis.AAC.1